MDKTLKAHLAELATIRREITALTSDLTNEQFNWKPGPEQWSVGQCLDHLRVTGEKLVPALDKAIATARAHGRTGTGPFRHGVIGGWFVRQLQPNPRRRVPVQKIYAPGSDLDMNAVVPALLDLQNALARTIESADGLDLARISVPSPAMPLLRLNVAAWFAATIAHEHRHLVQAARTKGRIDN